MKKITKKMGAIVLALAMCFSLCCVAFAATEDYTITIENSTSGKTYNAYKIFDATYDGNGHVSYTIASDSAWFDIVKAASNLEISDGTEAFTLTAVSTENGVTTYSVVQKGSNEAVIAVFNDLYKNGSIPSGASSVTGTGNGSSLTITVGEPGYYFVTSQVGTVVTITTAAPAATVVDKNDEPSMTKNILHHEDGQEDSEVDVETDAMGDDVEFIVHAYVPLYVEGKLVTDYTFTDELEDGLTFDVASGNYTTETVSGVTHYYLTSTFYDTLVTFENSDGTKSTLSQSAYDIVFELTDVTVNSDGSVSAQGFVLSYNTYDSTKYVEGDPDTIDTSKYPATATVTIDYHVHVSEAAVYENENTMTMTWRATDYDNPEPNNPTYSGEIVDNADVYVAGIQIIKVDATTSERLANAEFTLTGENLDEVKFNKNVEYTPLTKDEYLANKALGAEGETVYFKLLDGNYTTIDPYDLNEPTGYVTDTQDPDYEYIAYKETVTYDYEYTPVGGTSVSGTTTSDGILSFFGLTQGSYTLTETAAPDGYNKLSESITFEITFDETTHAFNINVTSNNATFTQDGAIFTVTIDNNAGTELPSTGGIGTTIFYVIGGVLVVGAVVVLVTRRRMTREG